MGHTTQIWVRVLEASLRRGWARLKKRGDNQQAAVKFRAESVDGEIANILDKGCCMDLTGMRKRGRPQSRLM